MAPSELNKVVKYFLLSAICLVGCTTKTPGSPTFTLALSPDAKHTISYRSHSYAGPSSEYYTLFINKINPKFPKESEKEILIANLTASTDARLNPISAVWTSNSECQIFLIDGMSKQPKTQNLVRSGLQFTITSAHGDTLLPQLDQALEKNAALSRRAWLTSETQDR